MSIAIARSALLWCTLINYGVLLLWVLLVVLPHERLYRLWGRLFHLPTGQFDALNVAGITLYKMLIILFNLVPYIALCIVG
jgi:hypothetical protein